MLERIPDLGGANYYFMNPPDVTFSRRHHPTSDDPDPSNLINLNFSGHRTSSVFLYRSNGTPLEITRSRKPMPDTHIQLNLRQLLSTGKANSILDQKLENWHLREKERRELIEVAVKTIGRALVSATPSDRDGSVMDLHFRLALVHLYCFEFQNEPPPMGAIYSYCFEFQNEPPPMGAIYNYDEIIRMVPADERSIESLHKGNKVIVSSKGGHCVICVDEFSEGCQVVRMPCCSHDFHGDCIDKWLRTSHYCPLCRFQMPTS